MNFKTHPNSSGVAHSSAEEQILHLKRLLVTLKQQYEKNLQAINEQLQNEINHKQALQKELDQVKLEGQEGKKHQEEEIQALKQQQLALKEILKKNQEEIKQLRVAASNQTTSSDLAASQQRVEQLERVIPYLRERTEEANLETEQLRDELEQTYHKIKSLQAELVTQQQAYEKQIKDLQQSSPLSNGSVNSGSQEINRNGWMQQETKILETRYAEMLNEKLIIEHQVKQLQQQLEHQSSNISAFKTHIQELEQQNKLLECSVQEKDHSQASLQQKIKYLEGKIQQLGSMLQDKNLLQEKYEQLREEVLQLVERLEQAVEARVNAEQQLSDLLLQVKDQKAVLAEQDIQLTELMQERDRLQQDVQQLRGFLEDSEARLKVAQQHLAKKVKEAAFLNEKTEENKVNLAESQQQIEISHSQIHHLQTSIDLYQKQEKKLQEQLHEALKSTESQVAKWEEKYFKMYDKWQESENRIRDLKKFEEKHHQMQNLLANLGSFMGHSFPASPLFHAAQESVDKSTRPAPLENSHDFPNVSSSKPEGEERYDLFGVKHSPDKLKPNLFS